MSTTFVAPRPQAGFTPRYALARDNFLRAASRASGSLEHHVLPEYRGSEWEALALDAALIPSDRPGGPIVVVSSGIHGVEGICGSGCQVATLEDADLLAKAARQGVDLLFLHAINPHGFSHLRRANEDNVDLNRNFLDFADPPPDTNPAYAELHDLLLPTTWPPSPEVLQSLQAYIARHGIAAYRRTVTAGQRSRPDGLFYAGNRPTWSNRMVRDLLRRHVATRPIVAWVDLHTGLGPWGHGEKIHAGPPDATALAAGRATWGADVVAAWEGDSASAQVLGFLTLSARDECPDTELLSIALEFGTVPYDHFLDAVRGDHWLHRHPEAPPELAQRIRQDMVAAFYQDNDAWRGMVTAQSRVAVLQACLALGSRSRGTHG
ncbi:MAG: M14 family metallopeptidase [Pigmentiphaga sp.]